jgi:uncharacterized cupin superfamily protein
MTSNTMTGAMVTALKLRWVASRRETAHQLINTSDSQELKYLAVATSESPEIAEYPDSDKIGVFAEFSANGDGKPTVMRYIIRGQAEMTDYSEGE